MHNIRGVPQGRNNLTKEDRINNLIQTNQVDLYAAMESGVYNDKKPPIPLLFNKILYNNIKEGDPEKHKTPLGAGTLIWANDKITL